MAHEFKETASYYISKSGNDGNAGSDRNSPMLTINGLNNAQNEVSVVIGTGLYDEQGLESSDGGKRPNGMTFKGDGLVIYKGDLIHLCYQVTNNDLSWSNTFFLDWGGHTKAFASGTDAGIFEDNTYLNCGEGKYGSSESMHIKFNRNKLLNGTTITFDYDEVNLDDGSHGMNQNIFINCSLVLVKSKGFNGNYVDVNTLLEFDTLGDAEGARNNCIRGSIKIAGTTYASLELAQAANPTACPQSFNLDPLFIGDPDKLEFSVSSASPLLGTGLNGVNIGGVKSGKLQNSSSFEWGLAPESAGNTKFVDGALVIDGVSTTATRESKEVDLGQVVRSPTLRLNGISDFLNNVPDNNNNLLNPNHLTIECQYAGLDKVYSVWKAFRYNEAMKLDNTSKSNGESGFDWDNLVDIELRFIKIRALIRDDYTVV